MVAAHATMPIAQTQVMGQVIGHQGSMIRWRRWDGSEASHGASVFPPAAPSGRPSQSSRHPARRESRDLPAPAQRPGSTGRLADGAGLPAAGGTNTQPAQYSRKVTYDRLTLKPSTVLEPCLTGRLQRGQHMLQIFPSGRFRRRNCPEPFAPRNSPSWQMTRPRAIVVIGVPVTVRWS